MTVNELKQMLNNYPDDMEIVNGRMSDYQIIDSGDWGIIHGVEKDGWVMRSHATMSDENKKNEKAYLYLSGN